MKITMIIEDTEDGQVKCDTVFEPPAAAEQGACTGAGKAYVVMMEALAEAIEASMS